MDWPTTTHTYGTYMDISMRYIPTDYSKRSDGVIIASGNKPALCFVGKNEARCIINTDEGVAVSYLSPEDVLNSNRIKGYETDEEAIAKFQQYFNTVLKKKTVAEEAFTLMSILSDPPPDFDQIETKPEPILSPKKKSQRKAPRKKGPGKSSIITDLAEELGMQPPKVRQALRKAGFSAPYDGTKKQYLKALK